MKQNIALIAMSVILLSVAVAMLASSSNENAAQGHGGGHNFVIVGTGNPLAHWTNGGITYRFQGQFPSNWTTWINAAATRLETDTFVESLDENTLRTAILPGASGQGQPTPTPTPTILEQVQEQLREYAAGSRYDAVARLRVLSDTDYRIQYESVEWPDEHPLHPVFFNCKSPYWNKQRQHPIRPNVDPLRNDWTVSGKAD